jgi:ferredoxin
MGMVALLSPVKIVRDAEPCIDCGKCSKACPAQVPVDRLVTIRSAECMSCMECVAACPAKGALELKVARRFVLGPGQVAAVLALLFFAAVLFGRASGHWASRVPEDIYIQWVRHAGETAHP